MTNEELSKMIREVLGRLEVHDDPATIIGPFLDEIEKALDQERKMVLDGVDLMLGKCIEGFKKKGMVDQAAGVHFARTSVGKIALMGRRPR